MMKEHEELRFATNQLLLQHDKVCQELVQLRYDAGAWSCTHVLACADVFVYVCIQGMVLDV